MGDNLVPNGFVAALEYEDRHHAELELTGEAEEILRRWLVELT